MSYMSFDFTFWKGLVCVIAIALCLYCFINNLRYSEKTPKVYFFEGLRLIILTLFILTFMEPEWVEVIDKNEKPELIIAIDDSHSMTTADVLVGQEVIKRQELIEQLMASDTVKKLSEKFNVKALNFSGLNDNKEATNLNHFLKQQIENNEVPRAMVVLGDGDWNEGGNPLEAAVQYRGNIPIFTVGTGSEKYLPDVVLKNVRPPVFGLINEKISIPFRVLNHMDNDLKTKVSLKELNGQKIDKVVNVVSVRFADSNLVWKPTKAGIYKFVLSTPVQEGEYITDNNETTFTIKVKEEKLKVLVVESWPRWEYRFLRNALMRDPGVEVHTLLYQMRGMKIGTGLGYLPEFPQTKEELSQYDVVFLGDVKVGDGQLTTENLIMLNGLVKSQGSGLVFMPGHQGNQNTFLDIPEADEMLPVVLNKKRTGHELSQEAKIILTFEGKDHHLTMLADNPANNQELWKNLPGFQWSSAPLRAKEGAAVLAVHGTVSNKWGRLPLIVTKPLGNGYTLFMGTDSAYRWRHGVEDKYHYRYWGQVVRWMSHKRHISANKNIRVFYSPETPKQGDSVNLQATINDNSGAPLNKAHVICELTSPEGNKSVISLSNSDNEWGVYKGDFKSTLAGKYKVTFKVPEVGILHTIKIDVKQESFEIVGQPSRFDVLKEISSISKGEFIPYQKFDTVIARLDALPEAEIREKRYRLWNQPWWVGLIILLLIMQWSISKRMGMI
jgi:hypothetical protein